MDMRGLSNFIADIRKATTSREAEAKRVAQELGKIRTKFKEGGMTPYDRKKYVCKLLFIFMLGYEVDFGHMEAVQLLSGTTASEKIIGYAAITVLLHENHPLLTLTTHTIAGDIAKGDDLRKTLGLTAVANVGGKDFAEAMHEHVRAAMVTRTLSPLVRRKAVLCALRLFRKAPATLHAEEVGPVVTQLIESPDFALSTCACALAQAMLQDPVTAPHVRGVKIAAIKKLHSIVIEKATPDDYVHYMVPCPWLQCKLLRLLQSFEPPTDLEEARKISTILSKIIKAAERVISETQQQVSYKRGTSVNRSNCIVATLVEAVSLSILWDCDAQVLGESREALALLIGDKRDANNRYLGLTLLNRMSYCASYPFAEQALQYQATVVQALHDADSSVRLRALDLLCAMCTAQNAARVVGELQDYLPLSHPSVREDLAIMIAVLAEKFCTDASWYVDVMVALLQQAGEFVPQDVWHRLIHIVVNTQPVQKHAAELFMQILSDSAKAAACHEVVVEAGAIILGEFGYQIALAHGFGPLEQLQALHARWSVVSDPVRATMLHTFVKFYNLYDDAGVRERIQKIFLSARCALDAEVQQRAAEYYALVTQTRDDILEAALEPLPPFDVATGALTQRLRERQHGVGATDEWAKRAEQRDTAQMAGSNVVKTAAAAFDSAAAAPGKKGAADTKHIDPTAAAASPIEASTSAAAAAAAAAASPTPVAAPPILPPPSSAKPASSALDDIFGIAAPAAPVTLATVAGGASAVESNVRRLSFRAGGILLDDAHLRVEIAGYDSRGADARFSLKITNPGATPLSLVSAAIAQAPLGLLLQAQPVANAALPSAGASTTANFAGRAQAVFSGRPTVLVSAVATENGHQRNVSFTLPVPVSAPRFVEPYQTNDTARFDALWAQLGSTPGAFAPTAATAVPSGPHASWGGSGWVAACTRAFLEAGRLHAWEAPSGPGGARLLGMGAMPLQPGDAGVQFVPIIAVATEKSVSVRCANAVLGEQVLQVLVDAVTNGI